MIFKFIFFIKHVSIYWKTYEISFKAFKTSEVYTDSEAFDKGPGRTENSEKIRKIIKIK